MDNLTIGFILIGVAFLLLIAELFLTTGGVLLVVAGIADLLGLVMVFTYGELYTGVATLAAEVVILPLLAGLVFYIWPHTPMGRRLMMRAAGQNGSTLATAHQELDSLKGRIGKAVSVLRPAGVVEFDGRRVDCLSEGMLIEPDTWVRCVEVKSGHVVVRPIDAPDLKDLENTQFE